MARTDNRRIVLTGVTRGLGRALLRKFVELGHTVIGCGRSESGIAMLQREYGAPHHFAICDVADAGQVATWAAEVLRDGPPDLLLNNAAIANSPAPLWQVTADEFDRGMSVNVSGTANVLRGFLPAMVDKRTGVIVNFSSGWGRSTAPNVAPYCASKWAIEGLTQALAQELPAGMAAVPLNPGIIDTDLLRQVFGAESSKYKSPEAWAERAAPFLLALDAKDNGKQLTVR